MSSSFNNQGYGQGSYGGGNRDDGQRGGFHNSSRGGFENQRGGYDDDRRDYSLGGYGHSGGGQQNEHRNRGGYDDCYSRNQEGRQGQGQAYTSNRGNFEQRGGGGHRNFEERRDRQRSPPRMGQSQNTFGGNQGRQDRGGYGGGDQGWNNRRPERVFENSNRGRQPDNHGEERQSYVNNDDQAFHGDSDNRMKNRGGQRDEPSFRRGEHGGDFRAERGGGDRGGYFNDRGGRDFQSGNRESERFGFGYSHNSFEKGPSSFNHQNKPSGSQGSNGYGNQSQNSFTNQNSFTGENQNNGFNKFGKNQDGGHNRSFGSVTPTEFGNQSSGGFGLNQSSQNSSGGFGNQNSGGFGGKQNVGGFGRSQNSGGFGGKQGDQSSFGQDGQQNSFANRGKAGEGRESGFGNPGSGFGNGGSKFGFGGGNGFNNRDGGNSGFPGRGGRGGGHGGFGGDRGGRGGGRGGGRDNADPFANQTNFFSNTNDSNDDGEDAGASFRRGGETRAGDAFANEGGNFDSVNNTVFRRGGNGMSGDRTDDTLRAPRDWIPEERDVEELYKECEENSNMYSAEDHDNIVVHGPMKDNRITLWENSGLDEKLVEILVRKNKWIQPYPIQSATVPAILKGYDVAAKAETGSGKTGAFAIPIVDWIIKNRSSEGRTIHPYAVILEPTRELANQVYDEFKKITYNTGIRVVLNYGQINSFKVRTEIQKGVDIYIGTIGRLMDFQCKGNVDLRRMKFFVLDEADNLLKANDIGQLEEIMAHPYFQEGKSNSQTLLFSATMNPTADSMATRLMRKNMIVGVENTGSRANRHVMQKYVQTLSSADKREMLEKIFGEDNAQGKVVKTLIFVATKKMADMFSMAMPEGLTAASIHGDRSQDQRTQTINDFKRGKIHVLVGTDVCARGLDIPKLDRVIVYDTPDRKRGGDMEQMLNEIAHRIGRTGRQQAGTAIIFCDHSVDQTMAKSLVEFLSEAQQEVPDFLTDIAEGRGGRSGFGKWSSGFGSGGGACFGSGSVFGSGTGFGSGGEADFGLGAGEGFGTGKGFGSGGFGFGKDDKKNDPTGSFGFGSGTGFGRGGGFGSGKSNEKKDEPTFGFSGFGNGSSAFGSNGFGEKPASETTTGFGQANSFGSSSGVEKAGSEGKGTIHRTSLNANNAASPSTPVPTDLEETETITADEKVPEEKVTEEKRNLEVKEAEKVKKEESEKNEDPGFGSSFTDKLDYEEESEEKTTECDF